MEERPGLYPPDSRGSLRTRQGFEKLAEPVAGTMVSKTTQGNHHPYRIQTDVASTRKASASLGPPSNPASSTPSLTGLDRVPRRPGPPSLIPISTHSHLAGALQTPSTDARYLHTAAQGKATMIRLARRRRHPRRLYQADTSRDERLPAGWTQNAAEHGFRCS
ncbi:hypothetical protein BKA70DRAFT_1346874 [Coprinopsis sp. MPI-PUGE-AT-0042]|nr:hypothetical protein BKA70DRAFT_1346874 [Coprinopsis sp. MPI-PUGE-AT-0042]